MSTSARFTQELAHLVWLLVHRATQVDDQKRALRAMMVDAATAEQRVEHAAVGLEVVAGVDRQPVPLHVHWLSELATRMASHSVRSITVQRGARASELLGLARLLARPGRRDDQGEAFDAQLQALAPATIAVQLGHDGFVRTPTPPTPPPVVGTRRTPPPGTRLARVGATVAAHMPEAAFVPPADVGDLVIRLRAALGPESAPPLLDTILRKVEDLARAGSWVEVIELAARLLEREATVTDPAIRRAFEVQVKRLATADVLRGVAEQLPAHREVRDDAHAILRRQGPAAAEVLIGLLTRAETTAQRRAYHDAIVQCPAAAESLATLLGDERWYVVRNAAELLGEMGASGADERLAALLQHREPRVRSAATLALIRLGTTRAAQSVVQALGDPDASVRLKAAHGLCAVRTPGAVPALLSALDVESDHNTQHALLSALGHQPADEAVDRLVREAAPGTFLKRRPQGRRLAAIQALGEAGTPGARSALRGLAKDRDPAVRELVDRLLRDTAQEVPAHH